MRSKDKSKDTSKTATWRLLKPHAKALTPQILLTVLLGSLTAATSATVMLLIDPVFRLVLFPGQDTGFGKGDGIVGGAVQSGSSGVTDGISGLGLWLQSVFGFAWLANERMAALMSVLVVLVVLTMAGAAAQYLFNQLSNQVSLRLVVALRLRITRHLMRLGLHYHGQRKLGDLLSRISSDIQLTLMAVIIWFRDFLQNGMMAVWYLGVAAYAEFKLTMVMIVMIPLLAFPVSLLARKVRKRSTRSLTSLGASVQVLTQMFSGIRTVKAFRAEEAELKRYADLNERYYKDSMRMVRAVSMTQAWTTISSQLGLGVLLLLVGVGGIYYDLFGDSASLTVFFIANAQAYSYIKRLIRAITRMEESVGASVRLHELLDETPDLIERPTAVDVPSFEESLVFDHVGFSYPEGDGPALDDIQLEVRRGETLAIVGASGGGKSTLMGLVCRFFDPNEGALLVDGRDLREITIDSWTKLYSMVDQAPFLFHTSIAENLRYAKPGATQEELVAACQAAQIHDFIEALPDGYETNVADAGARLSGGQRQRITIARALLKGAPLLLLDEATSALDTESERGVQEALERLMQGRTVIVIAHRLSTIQNADRIAVLEGGRLVELGTHTELSEKSGAYARALELQKMA